MVEPADVGTFIIVWSASLQQGTLAGDYDGDGVVWPADASAFVSAWFVALNGIC